MCLQHRLGRRGKKGNAASLKIGVEPKATKVALNPASLSPVEPSSTTGKKGEQRFYSNHFPLAPI